MRSRICPGSDSPEPGKPQGAEGNASGGRDGPDPRRAADRPVKIATFNINNIYRRLPNLLNWLDAAKPDVLCLQELKAADRQFPESVLLEAGYSAVWQAERAWNGSPS
jgi:Endonuclease/Exonuclease/phosphatase family